MKRTELIRRVSRAAREAGVSWRLVRNGRRHDTWECDSMPISIPRHRELNELTARGITAALEERRGKDGWR